VVERLSITLNGALRRVAARGAGIPFYLEPGFILLRKSIVLKESEKTGFQPIIKNP